MENAPAHATLNARKWDTRAETYDERRFNYFRLMQRKVVSFLELKQGIHFLDIGCGTGYAVRLVNTLLQGKGVFFGADISPRMIEIAKANAVDFTNIHFVVGDAEKMPVDSDAFDIILCTNSFHHYQNPEKALGEIFRLLKQRGRFYVMDVTADNWLIRRIDTQVKKRENEHVKFYSTVEFCALFRGVGMSYVSSRTLWRPEKLHIAQKEGRSIIEARSNMASRE